MGLSLIGKKIGMTQYFNADGVVFPVTVVQAGPCTVVKKKTIESDGYNAVQLGYGNLEVRKLNKPMKGYFKGYNAEPTSSLKEFRDFDLSKINAGQEILVTSFTEGDFVDVTGVSIGKGYQGVVKRHGFAGGPKTHGSNFHRRPGSIGMCEHPAETPKGRKMAGHMGAKKITTLNLKIIKILEDKNLLLVKGAVPGHKNGIVYIRESVKKNGSEKRNV